MTRIERIMAYVDGEMAPADRTAVEAELSTDAGLAAEVGAQRELAAAIGRTYAPIAEEPVPLRLALAAQAANDPAWRRIAPWAAAAAALVMGVLTGQAIQTPHLVVGAPIPARGQLARALEHDLAADAAPVRIGISFRARDGRYCRTFRSGPDRLAGLACRSAGGWRLETATAWGTGPEPQYRAAASDTPAPVLAAADAMMAGDAMDAAQERAARDAGWR